MLWVAFAHATTPFGSNLTIAALVDVDDSVIPLPKSTVPERAEMVKPQ
jgi:hypothetical protein